MWLLPLPHSADPVLKRAEVVDDAERARGGGGGKDEEEEDGAHEGGETHRTNDFLFLCFSPGRFAFCLFLTLFFVPGILD
jgi:hypothetical protein